MSVLEAEARDIKLEGIDIVLANIFDQNVSDEEMEKLAEAIEAIVEVEE